MGESTNAVFVLESPSVEDLLSQRSETSVASAYLKLLDVPHITMLARDDRELVLAGELFRQGAFRGVHVSSHGDANGAGLILTDGSGVAWRRLLELFPFPKSGGFLSLSACSAFAGKDLAVALAGTGAPPSEVFGYRTPVTWESAALVSALLFRVMRAQGRPELPSLLLGAYFLFGLDLELIAFEADRSGVIKLSGSAVLDQLASSLVARDPKLFKSLIRARGLLDPNSEAAVSRDWDKWWEHMEIAKEKLAVAKRELRELEEAQARERQSQS